jgi:SAM-dependent methyltransferase
MIHYLCAPDRFASFAEAYNLARRREGRLFDDDQLRLLPTLPMEDPRSAEWRIRGGSARRLLRHLLAGAPRPRTILDVGCGNGWMTRQLAGIPGSVVFGIDVHEAELAQADRVFGGRENLRFLFGDVFTDLLPFDRADTIILAGAIQYFADLPALLSRLVAFLADGGEIHILDSPLYAACEIRAARERSNRYYHDLGVPEMSRRYHHHPIDTLAPWSPRWRYRPRRWLVRCGPIFGISLSPFPWLSIPNPEASGR